MYRRAPSSKIYPDSVVSAARALVGVPFRHQGRTVRGLDCLGTVVRALSCAGLRIEDKRDYPREPDFARMWKEFGDQLVLCDRADYILPGRIILFKDPDWLHCGISTGEGVVHSRGPEGIGPGVIEHLVDDQSWSPRIKGVWVHPAMET